MRIKIGRLSAKHQINWKPGYAYVAVKHDKEKNKRTHQHHYSPACILRKQVFQNTERLRHTLTVIEAKTTLDKDCSNCNSTC